MSTDSLSMSVRHFVEQVGEKSPTPGGGSVAALVGGLAVALSRMVVVYTVGKPKYAEHEDRLKQVLDEFKSQSEIMGRLIDEDISAYQQLAAYPRTNDPERRRGLLEKAIEVPMQIMAVAATVVIRLDEIKTCTNPFLLSDLHGAAILASAAVRVAALSVQVNLAELSDREDARRKEGHLESLLKLVAAHEKKVLAYRPS